MTAQPPILVKPIPPQVVNEGALLNAISLGDYIQSPTLQDGEVRFLAELSTRESLPKGFICTPDGMLTGIFAKGTQGTYTIVVIAENDSGVPFTTELSLTINPAPVPKDQNRSIAWWTDLKAKVWEAVGKDLPAPDLFNEMSNRPITAVEIYYLLQRFATLTIWDAYNLEVPGEKNLLTLEDSSPHYEIYDRGSCLVGAPKDLYSHERTLEDALKTARAMAREAYRRGWTVQLAGFEKMARATWIEFQHLGDKHGKTIEILHYSPSPEDVRIYSSQAKMNRFLSS